jgi:hypothetical protein
MMPYCATFGLCCHGRSLSLLSLVLLLPTEFRIRPRVAVGFLPVLKRARIGRRGGGLDYSVAAGAILPVLFSSSWPLSLPP